MWYMLFEYLLFAITRWLFKPVSSLCLAFLFTDKAFQRLPSQESFHPHIICPGSPLPVLPEGLQAECGRIHQREKPFSFTWVTAIMQNDKRSS